jgi:hypothetical protein
MFPIKNIWEIVQMERTGKDTFGSAQGAWYLELVARHLRWSTYIVLALAYHATFDINTAKEWEWGWVSFIFARNYLVMVTMFVNVLLPFFFCFFFFFFFFSSNHTQG